MEPFVGQIMQVGFSFAPNGWITCQGQLLPISQYTAVFSLLGTTFGGNGVSTFQVPDLQGRAAVGVGTNRATGSNYEWGQTAGTENVTLTQQNMPAHTHTAVFTGTGGGGGGPLTLSLNAVQAPGTTPTPAAGCFLATGVDAAGSDTPQIYVPAGAPGTQVAIGGLTVSGGGGFTGGTVANAVTGGSLPTSVMNPYLAVYTIMALNGIFPSRP